MDTSARATGLPTDDLVFSIITTDNPLNNWSAHTIRIWGKRFPTAEHAYQYKKFEHNPVVARKIIRASSPWAAKQFSREAEINTAAWNKRRKLVMAEILRAKLQQHADVRKVLMATKDRAIVEQGFEDNYWGIGRDGSGKNILGKIWMQLRDEL